MCYGIFDQREGIMSQLLNANTFPCRGCMKLHPRSRVAITTSHLAFGFVPSSRYRRPSTLFPGKQG